MTSRRRGAWVAAVVLTGLALRAVPANAVATEPPDDPPPKLSLPTEDDRAAWQRPGFRLHLGMLYGRLRGLDGAPSGRLLGPLLRLGVRLDADWSLLTSLQYVAATEAGGLAALRFAGTLDPTWHITRSLDVAIGLGFGGLVEGGADAREDHDPDPDTLNQSYTYASATPPLPSCDGTGVAGLVRVGWTFVLGPRASTSVALELDGQWTGCVHDTNRVEPDTARPIVRRQWWPHVGGSLAWTVAWR